MNEIAALEDGYTFHSPDYGSVKLTATRATKLGENFMSLTFYATAHLADGVQHKAFVKVIKELLWKRSLFPKYLGGSFTSLWHLL